MPKPKPLATRVALVTGAGSGIGKAITHRLAAEGACVVVADLNPDSARAVAEELGGADRAVAVEVDVTDEEADRRGVRRGGAGVRRRGPGGEQRRDLHLEAVAGDDRRRLGLPARHHGARFVPGVAGGRTRHDRAGHRRGHRLHRVQELRVRRAEQHRVLGGQGRPGAPGPAAGSRARRARDPGQRRQPGRCGARVGDLRRRLGRAAGRHVRHPGGAARRDLRQRTILKREVLPEHVANAVFALVGGDLAQTTGLHVPVDAGIAAAFLR